MSGELDAKRLRRALLAKGFEEMPGDHHFFVLVVDGRRTRIRTKVSRGHKSIAAPIVSEIARQMGIAKRDLVAFADCSLSKEAYAALVAPDLASP